MSGDLLEIHGLPIVRGALGRGGRGLSRKGIGGWEPYKSAESLPPLPWTVICRKLQAEIWNPVALCFPRGEVTRRSLPAVPTKVAVLPLFGSL